MGSTWGAGWTDERVELLKKLWQDGLSASQIAKQLGGVTRAAVIGNVHRLGLSGQGGGGPSRNRPSTPRATRPPPSKATAVDGDRRQFNRVSKPNRIYGGDSRTSPVQKKQDAVKAALICEPLPEPVGELAATCDLLGLGSYMCKWPIGDPAREGFGFCGRRAEGPYCQPHTKRAFASHAARDWVDRRLAMPTRAQRAA